MKKIYIVSKDSALYGVFSNNGYIANLISDFENIESIDDGILLISDIVVPINSIFHWRDRFANNTIFYMISNRSTSKEMKLLNAICKSLSIHAVPPKLTLQQIFDYVDHKLNDCSDEPKKHRVVGFLGLLSRIGTTTLTLHIANELYKGTGNSVAVLCLNPYSPGTHLINYKGKFLDELITSLSHRVLSSDQLIQSMHKKDDFHYLAGNSDFRKVLRYKPENIEYLISVAQETFDFVLLDLGSYLENALAIQGLISSQMRFLVTTQHKQSIIDSFIRIKDQILDVLQIDTKEMLLLVNKTHTTGIKPMKLAEILDVNFCKDFPDFTPYDFLIDETKDFEALENDVFLSNARTVASTIAAYYDVSFNSLTKSKIKKRWLFK